MSHAPTSHRLARLGLLRELDDPWSLFETVTPNWFGAIMATALIAVVGDRLPQRFAGLPQIATGFWMLAMILLVALSAATALHWARHPREARRHLADPVMAHFYGAPPMAVLTFGAATILAGGDLIGQRAATAIDWVLWLPGTAAALATATAIPYAMFTRDRLRTGQAFGGWLLPVVSPMVAAWTGALLVEHAPAGELRSDMLLLCYAMLGLSLLACLMVITLIWHRLANHGVVEARMVPTGWLIVGPLALTTTTANLLGSVAHLALHRPYSTALQAAGVVIGVPMMGFAGMWSTIAAAITFRTWRDHLPFSLTWWSFTFAIGACTTATIGLADHLETQTLRLLASVLAAGFVAAWAVVGYGTARDGLSGTLFLAAGRDAPAPGRPVTEPLGGGCAR